jgi:hypothetical protein
MYAENGVVKCLISQVVSAQIGSCNALLSIAEEKSAVGIDQGDVRRVY